MNPTNEPRPEVPELLIRYDEERRRRHRLLRGAGWSSLAVLVVLTVAEIAFAGSMHLLMGETIALLVVLVLLLMFASSALLCWIGYGFAEACARRGQTRVQADQVFAILALCALASIPFGGMALQERRMWPVAIAVGAVVFWHVASLVLIGYVLRFWPGRAPN